MVLRVVAFLLLTAAQFVAGHAQTVTPAPATSQSAAEAGRPQPTRYGPEFFAQFAPANAFQMIERVPGFSFDAGDSNVRGFSGAAGNVVINGQRPSSKSEPLDIVLQRIPASSVARIEVAPGDAFGSDYVGRPQVANIVTTSGPGLSGTIEATLRRGFLGDIQPEGSASAVLKRGNSTFNLAAGIDNSATSEKGTDRLLALPSATLIELRRKVNEIHDPNGYVSASWEHVGGANRTAHLNGRFALDRFSLTQANDVYPAVGPMRDDRLTQRYRRREWELGGDVTRPLLGGGLKLVGLATRRQRTNRDISLIRVNSKLTGGFEQTLVDTREETLGRATWSRTGWNGWTAEIGGEVALNRLVSDVDLAAFDGNGGRTPIDLPIDHAVVKEIRGEAFANAGRNLAANLRLDLSTTFEASRLTVSGDADAERTLKFFKPKASFDWRVWNVHAQFSIERTVAQLQFEDFISAAELTNNRVNGGNAELLPQRAWEALATFESPLLGDGLAKFELGYTSVSLVQDRVPTPEGFDAPGNLGGGRELIVRGTIDAPLGKFGIKGGRLTLYGSIVDTAVRDPYTGFNRRFSGNSTAFWKVDFRQDLGKFAWGLHAESSSNSTVFRLDELDTFVGLQPYTSIFADYRPSNKTTVTIGARNPLDLPARRYRRFFEPTRATAVASSIELRERNPHVTLYMTVKHSFG